MGLRECMRLALPSATVPDRTNRRRNAGLLGAFVEALVVMIELLLFVEESSIDVLVGCVLVYGVSTIIWC